MFRLSLMRGFMLLLLLLDVVGGAIAVAESAESVRADFLSPPREYSSGPLWVWNDLLTEEQIRSTLQDLAGQHVRQPFVHPRPGLMTPYLSEDWFRLWKVALDEAEKLDMNVWIYDENSYPSGFAGGFVPEAMPESRGLGVDMKTERQAPGWSEDIVAVHRRIKGGYEQVTEAVKAGESMPEGRYYVTRLLHAGISPWFGGKSYVDLLMPGVTEKFLEITLGAYEREIGEQFAKRVPGSFTDEPHLRPAGGNHWTPDLEAVFQKRWGYSLRNNLPSLWLSEGDWKRVRHNYYQVLLELFVERWSKPYYHFCEERGLEFTGHYWEHGWPGTGSAPDNMAMYAWHQRPAIDILFNQYSEGTQAQFGNVRAGLELASVANQMGRKRTLCEAYGGSGWDARFEDLKRIGDWLYVLGVNTLNEHLSHITLRGARKRDYPISFSYHAPWFQHYHVLADYFTRLSLAMSSGKQINEILVIEPTSTAWIYQATQGDKRVALGNAFQELVTDLAKKQVEFDIGSEDIIARNGSVEADRFVVGQRSYRIVVIPPHLENLNSKTMELIESFLNQGQVLCCGDTPPALVDGSVSERGLAAAASAGWRVTSAEALPDQLLNISGSDCLVRQDSESKGILYHHRRQLDDGDLLFLVNTSIKDAVSGQVEALAGGVQRWSLEEGVANMPYPFSKASLQRPGGGTPAGVNADFEIPPCGSLLLFLSKGAAEEVKSQPTGFVPVSAVGEMRIQRVAQNVLTLDYMDLDLAGEHHEAIPFYRAAELAFKANGLEHNPWDHAVQFRDELISKTFPEKSGFEVTYRFTIEEATPREIFIVIERTDLYEITCNGTPIQAEEGAWWLDKAFGKIDIARLVKVGANEVTIKAAPFTIFHEIESAYVIGDFDVAPRESGFAILPAKAMSLAPWNEQGLPLYGDAVAYTQDFEISETGANYKVLLPEWYGTVAQVKVNGKDAGHIFHAPWECDVSEQIVAGENSIEVQVYGTPKNTLGPHHGNPPLGFAGPGSFRSGPATGPPAGASYDTIGYGLFAPFSLERQLTPAQWRAWALEEVKRLEGELADRPIKDLKQAQRAWEQSARWTPLQYTSFSTDSGVEFQALEDESLLLSGTAAESDVYSYAGTTQLPEIRWLRLEVLPDDRLASSGPGCAFNGNFVLSKIEMEVKKPDGPTKAIALSAVSSSHEQGGFALEGALDENARSGWAINGGTGQRQFALFELSPQQLAEGDVLLLRLQQHFGSQHVLGRFRLAVSASPLSMVAIGPDLEAVLSRAPEARSVAEEKQLSDLYLQLIAPERAAMKRQLEKLQKVLACK